jgi:hypothetical protein
VITSKKLGLCETMLGKEFPSINEHKEPSGSAKGSGAITKRQSPTNSSLIFPILSWFYHKCEAFLKYTTSKIITVINFFGFPTEIWLKIYLKLLVYIKPIIFIADSGPLLPPLFQFKKDGLYLIFLRFNKRAHSKASPLFYSNNRF